MVELLPAEAFMRGGVWLLAYTPPSDDIAETLPFVLRLSGVGAYTPAFTSEAAAVARARELEARGMPSLRGIGFRSPQQFAIALDTLQAFGHTHLVFDPESDDAPGHTRFPIPDVLAELYRRFFGSTHARN